MFKREGKNGFYFESFCFEFGFLCGGWCHARASLVAQTVKNPPAMQETWVRSLGWEDLLEKGTAAHSSIRAWRISMVRGAWQAAVHGVTKTGSDTTED